MSTAPTATAQKQALTKNQRKKLKKKLKKALQQNAEDTPPNSTEHAQKKEDQEGVLANHQDCTQDGVAKGLPLEKKKKSPVAELARF